MKYIYVAGPYAKGDVAANVCHAIEAGHILRSLGFAPFIPHLFHFWHMLFQREQADWLALGEQWLQKCDALLRIPGESAGADAEAAAMKALGRPVFYSLECLAEAKRLGI